MKIISVVGARPNFMKIAPFCHAIEKYNFNAIEKIEHLLVHTGQHYDDKMSKVFFERLNIPNADINLEIGSGSHAEQVGYTMIKFEKVIKEHKPDWVVVVGDVNATCACSITAKKEHIKCAHIEAGLRSRDMSMPEEINRLVTDRISDLLLTPDNISYDNLIQEGTRKERIKLVGNIMIDTLLAQREKAAELDINQIIASSPYDNEQTAVDVTEGRFAVITMHRPSNVDTKEILEPIIDFMLDEVAPDMPLLWPMHPRTGKQLRNFGLWKKIRKCENLILMQPLDYHAMLRLNIGARVMFTDSGGLQEECCVLGTPCLTLRQNTERPITLQENGGLSFLVGNDVGKIREKYQKVLSHSNKPEPVFPALWDGTAAERMVEAIANY
jgi:UDP-N-acetylglucosamine 2-epimerase (non-hydrolysing)